jgi:hypothetical protein
MRNLHLTWEIKLLGGIVTEGDGGDWLSRSHSVQVKFGWSRVVRVDYNLISNSQNSISVPGWLPGGGDAGWGQSGLVMRVQSVMDLYLLILASVGHRVWTLWTRTGLVIGFMTVHGFPYRVCLELHQHPAADVPATGR